ncbi:hypothetical protein EDEG_02732 [Edhazardia aedis USNM 41457]|uniref:UBC core domain-containing protein n=1 Tax=Edhazardia aedis (strain USNM 41457) TaxID=1003232 RepID=J9DN94_EDHAE|nr:hypothetical protein EDEG_02732 [Edhazardia aedis USNM 41457]|eukprot:EJW02852.1 hypothetical protein EDEG_02732 [Edhazardia aedis USNM 41457]
MQKFNRRICREIKSLLSAKTPGITLLLDPSQTTTETDLSLVKKLFVEILGADDTLYAGEKFILLFDIPDTYPIEAPVVIFHGDNIPINEHVYSNGHICLSILYDNWSPAMTIESVCLSIISFLSSAHRKIRPPGDQEYCRRAKDRSPKEFHWSYED